MKLNEQIRIAREKRGLSAAELAEQLGVSKTAVDYWEAGRHAPRLAMLGAIERVLETKFNATDTPGTGAEVNLFPGVSSEDLRLAIAIARLPDEVRRAIETLVKAYDPATRHGMAPASSSNGDLEDRH